MNITKIKRQPWDGNSSLSGKILLVLCDADIGNTLLNLRYLKKLESLARKLILVMPKELKKSLRQSGVDYEIYPKEIDVNSLRFDCYVEITQLNQLIEISDDEEFFLQVDNQDKRLFKAHYINQRAYNVALAYKDEKELDVLKILRTTTDVQLYSFNPDESLHQKERDSRIKNLSAYTNDLYEISKALVNVHLLVSTDRVITCLASALGKSVYTITHDDDLNSKYIKTFKIDPSLEIVSCYLKNEVENYRLEMKANFFEACLKEVEKRTEILPVDVLKSKRSILWQAYEITHKQEYLDYLDAVLAEIYDLENGSNSAISNIATHSVIHKGLYSKAYELYSQIADNAIRDDYGDMLYSWACLNCRLKNFRTFLDFYECRFTKKVQPTVLPEINVPRWTGQEDARDKTLLIIVEQGYGDQFLFSKYIPLVQKHFKNVILTSYEGNTELLSGSFKELKVIPLKEIKTAQYDYYLPLMSILSALNLYPTDYQVKRWLTADEEKVKDFSQYITKDKFNIGIFWESSKSYITRYTDLKYLLPFGHLDNVQLYNLQIDKEDFECNYPDPSVNIINLAKHFNDFSDTAAAIENLDLVISTDSSVMNLAGALGKKTFGLFCEIPEWRWFELEGESVVWLESVKPFQTKHGNDFSEVIPKISDEIKLLVNEKFNT